MKIFVAGGAGYIGSAVVPELLARGHEVTVADLCWFGNRLPECVPVIRRDILDLPEDALRGFDQAIFLAGLSNDPMADFSPSRNFVSNAAAPGYFAYLARKGGVRRFIYAGSCSVYGFTGGELYDEDSPALSTYPYGISKLQGERAALQLAAGDFSVIVLRQGTVSGYSPRMRLDLIVNAMFRHAMERGAITVNNPAIWRPVLAMRDAVHAYACAVDAPPDASGVFNVASGNWTVGEVGEAVGARVGELRGSPVTVESRAVPDLRNYRVRTDRARAVLGFAPGETVETIVADLWANRDRFADFGNPAYHNIEIFRRLPSGPATTALR